MLNYSVHRFLKGMSKNKRGEKSWNGKLPLSEPMSRDSQMRLVGNWKRFVKNWLCSGSRGRPRVSSTTSRMPRNLVDWLRIFVT